MSLTPITSWSLQSPDNTVWVPSISNAGIVTWTSGGSVITATPPVFKSDAVGLVWIPTITNGGIVSITSSTQSAEFSAALASPDETVWEFWVTDAGFAELRSRGHAMLLEAQVEETSTTTGTGTLNLAGATEGNRTFVEAFGSGEQCFYTILDGSAWEYGLGTVTDGSPCTLARDLVLGSSAAGAKLSLGAGTKYVYCDMPPVCCLSNGVKEINDGSSSPSVKEGRVFSVNNASDTTVSSFSDGVPGQELILIFANGNTRLFNGGSIKNANATSWYPTANDVVSYVCKPYAPTGAHVWFETGRSVN